MSGHVGHVFHLPQGDASEALRISAARAPIAGESSIVSLTMTSLVDEPSLWNVRAHSWLIQNGADTLAPCRDIFVSPGTLSLSARGRQIVRLAVSPRCNVVERAYRLLLDSVTSRARASSNGDNAPTPGASHASIPVFVTPVGAKAVLHLSIRGDRIDHRRLAITNGGRARAQILRVEDLDYGDLDAPGYVLAGASMEIPLPPSARRIRVSAQDVDGVRIDRSIAVAPLRLLP